MALLAVGRVYCLGAAFRCGEHVAALCECAMRVCRGDHGERREQTASQSAPASKLFWINGYQTGDEWMLEAGPSVRVERKQNQLLPAGLAPRARDGHQDQCQQHHNADLAPCARKRAGGRFKLSGSSCGARFKMVLAFT